MARRTVGQLIRARRIVGDAVVETDVVLGVTRYEAEVLGRMPGLAGPGWRRMESRLPLDLVIWVPSGIIVPARLAAPEATRRRPP